MPQLATYACLLAFGSVGDEPVPLGGPINGFHLKLEYPRLPLTEDGDLVSRHRFMHRDELADHMASLRTVIARLDAGFEEDVWPATPGSHCALCPSRRDCPLPDSAHDFEHIEDAEEAREAALQYFVLKDAADRARKAVKLWAERTDEPIDIGNDM